jgi:hypothetical protein
MTVCLPDYRFYTGHGVALATLQNFTTFIQAQAGSRQIIAPHSLPVNPWPIETALGDGSVRGDGKPGHEWIVDACPIAAFYAFYAAVLYTTGSRVKSKPITIYTQTFDRGHGVYTRYNATIIYPVPGEDYTYTRKKVLDWRIRFTHLVEL